MVRKGQGCHLRWLRGTGLAPQPRSSFTVIYGFLHICLFCLARYSDDRDRPSQSRSDSFRMPAQQDRSALPSVSSRAAVPSVEDLMAGRKVWSSLKFGPFAVSNQVFHVSQSQLSYALVNLKPLLPGHVLVCPTRCVPRLSQLSSEETADLFLAVKRVSRTMERIYNASSLNIAVQDGVDAGQSVPHVQVSLGTS